MHAKDERGRWFKVDPRLVDGAPSVSGQQPREREEARNATRK